ncbi:pyruvate kinase [Candidatus Desulforudis audaxviator]|uniref:Pyruvate kinase n=1 Tax=Desulforudis audaxviator (strain MP104C) TaxID=477974 RepID=B1I3H0_DESAP|nr:pyruvate kinase [Candidatus Desulforudis audaxviator]ACA59568.1 pyruvate kinase [Candidatus Desulforudis audaxviator MP104C]AZK59552.1 Pyruvate kinase [Candidatus Desulforudis audaxviator]
MRHTKIICTIGPASESVEVLSRMVESGMNISRHNFSHGSREEHRRRINNVRTAAARTGRTVGIMVDLRGPKIRIGDLEPEPVELKAGDELTLTTEVIKGNRRRISVDYQPLPREVGPGNTILLGDGLVGLEVLRVEGSEVLCRVLNDALLTSRKGVNLPGVRTSIPTVTEKDIRDLHFALELGFDFVAASFVRRAEDILSVRAILEKFESEAHIVAKIETWEAVENLDDIIKVTDAVMVARGDLGLEIAAEEVPLVQKKIIARCNLAGKPVITATQMLESMIHNPRPTRAEASDVANAILDGTDAVMLSAETATGEYPVAAVETMDRIARRAEADLPYGMLLHQRHRDISRRTVTDAISYATCATAADLDAAAIITATQTGYTARMVAKYRPARPIVAVTPREDVVRRLTLLWGVQPVYVQEEIEDTDRMISASIEAALAAGLIRGGDLVVITAGVPVGLHGSTNLLKVHTVGNVLARGIGIGNQAVTGSLKIAHSAAEALVKIEPGDILVTRATDRDYVPAIEKSSGVITEVGGLTSHAAVVCLQFNLPVIVGVTGATEILDEGAIVTIDALRGLVYSGATRVL